MGNNNYFSAMCFAKSIRRSDDILIEKLCASQRLIKLRLVHYSLLFALIEQ